MGEEDGRLEAALGAALRSAGGLGEEHPEASLLVAYHHGNLSAVEAEAVLDHVAICRNCGDLLLELDGFQESSQSPAVGGPEQVSDLETERAWREVRDRLGETGGVDRSAGPSPPPRVARGRSVGFALAALFSLAVIGLGLRVGSLETELANLREPQLNLAILNLRAEGSTRGDTEVPAAGGNQGRFVVILNPPSFPVERSHRVEILRAEGDLVWASDGLRPTAAGNFHLELSHRLLSPGEYRIRLILGREATAEFKLRIEAAP